MSPIGLAVIGAGYWGPNLVRNALATPALKLEAVCDLDEERARAVVGPYATMVRTTSSVDDVLADPSVHAVAIATPAVTHFELVRRALESGKHVLVEKPLTANLDEARKVVELADTSGLILMCDHVLCYTPVVRKIRDLIHSGEIGDLQFVDAVRINLGLVQPDVDVIWDLAPHDLSVLDFVLPPGVRVEKVAAHGSDPIGAGRACVAYLSLWLSNGSLAHLNVNWLSPTKLRTTVIGGSRRTIVWNDLNPPQRLAVYDRGVDLAPPGTLDQEQREQALISYRIGDIQVPALPEREGLREVMNEFATAINTGSPPLTDGRSGLRVLAILEAATRSMEEAGAMVEVQA